MEVYYLIICMEVYYCLRLSFNTADGFSFFYSKKKLKLSGALTRSSQSLASSPIEAIPGLPANHLKKGTGGPFLIYKKRT